jgi:hypothetical protein
MPPSVIRTRNLSKQAAAHLRLRPPRHGDRLFKTKYIQDSIKQYFLQQNQLFSPYLIQRQHVFITGCEK